MISSWKNRKSLLIKMDKLIAKIEALLFIYGEPMDLKKIAKTLGAEESEVKEALKEMEEKYQADERGLFLVFEKEKVQLTTKPDFAKLLESVIKEELHENLTGAALETLSIVAYAGPLTRAELEYIRGVNSSFTLRNLLIRGLIRREVDSKRSNVFLYLPSFDLLKHLGISRTEDLPEYQRFQQLIEKLRHPAPAEPEKPAEPKSDGQPAA